MSESPTTPVEIDTKLAELSSQLESMRQRLSSLAEQAKSMAGADYYYVRRQRVTDMTFPEAREILEAQLSDSDSEYTRLASSTGWSHHQARTTLSTYDELTSQVKAIASQLEALNNLYTGWNRFFVVTSSAGHIHSSLSCSTCRHTTTFGWLPYLSGKSEAEAIKHFGPAATALCSVCFPHAPVERMDDSLTTKQRDALLAGETPEASAKKEYCPGSGERSATQVDFRRMSPSGRCPTCGHVGAVTQDGRMRKHARKEN